MLGTDSKPLIDSGDRSRTGTQAQSSLSCIALPTLWKHVRMVHRYSRLAPTTGHSRSLVQENGKWRFDSAAGAEEVIDRRVGRNELSAIQACLAYVDAQREYYTRNADNDPLLHYAQQLISSSESTTVSYWETSGDGHRARSACVRACTQRRLSARRQEGTPALPWLLLRTAEGAGAECGRRSLRLHGARQDDRRLWPDRISGRIR